MLSFNVRAGDDIWFGLRGASLGTFQQVVIKATTDDGGVTLLTPTEEIDLIPDTEAEELGVLGVRVQVTQAHYEDHALLGMIASDNVVILKGRKYRKQLQ